MVALRRFPAECITDCRIMLDSQKMAGEGHSAVARALDSLLPISRSEFLGNEGP